MTKPHLIIIAGPNGAGKSTLANEIVEKYGIESFDFDKEYYNRWEKFGYDPAVQRGCKEYVSEMFEKEISAAFSKGNHFCFESNYHTPDVINYVDRAEKAGFSKSLIFIGLKSDELAKKRVAFRVSNKGHFVSDKEIEKRFIKGLNLLDRTYHLYDQLYLTESFEGFKNKAMIRIDADGIVKRGIPSYMNFLPKLNEDLRKTKGIDKGLSF